MRFRQGQSWYIVYNGYNDLEIDRVFVASDRSAMPPKGYRWHSAPSKHFKKIEAMGCKLFKSRRKAITHAKSIPLFKWQSPIITHSYLRAAHLWR